MRWLATALAAAALLSAAPVALAQDSTPAPRATGSGEVPAPWRDAAAVHDALFEAQTDVILGEDASLRGASAPAARLDVPALAAALADARRALRTGDREGLAAARGTAQAAIFATAARRAIDAAGRGDVGEARRWLLVREFRTATRFSRPGADATRAVQALATRRLAPAAAAAAVRKDLLDAYQARLRELLADVRRGADDGLPERRAEAAAQAAGTWRILRARYVEDRGARAARVADARFATLRTAADAADAERALVGFTAAPLTAEEQARRAQQLLRFVALVPVEYDRGVDGTAVTKDFEIQEAVAFSSAAQAAFTDLRDALARRDPRSTDAAAAGLTALERRVHAAAKRPGGVAPADAIAALEDQVETSLRRAMPDRWKQPTDESDYDLIALTLDRLEQAVGAGQYQQAEQARLEAYAFFEFGPERRLKAFDPGLATDVEGLVWFGARGSDGLAELIADRAPRRQVRATRLALDDALGEAAATLGDQSSRTSVVTNAAILVFREGLEAVLILAAITASLVRQRRRLRRPIFVGAFLGLLGSLLTFVLAQTLLSSLDQYGEKLEAVTGIVAILVLLLVTNWFFHRVYWSEWIGRFHRQRKKIEQQSFWGAQAVGFVLLGLTSVYREGFETVLFLQSLQLSAGTASVVEGAGLGLALTLAVGLVTFKLQRKLPYKKMLIVTGVMIGFVLVVMVGQTVRTMQGTGWLPITTLGADFPSWTGMWLGVYPTVETVLGQMLAAVFVIGSYYLAQEVRVKRPQRRALRREGEPGGGDDDRDDDGGPPGVSAPPAVRAG